MITAFRRLSPGAAAFAIYVLLSVLFFSPIPDLRSAYAGVGADPLQFVWALHWWPWAVAHQMNPFITKFLWYPEELNLAWSGTTIPALAFPVLPVTLLWNAVVAYNVITILSPAFGALTAFLLARHITGDFAASIFGGYIFGFSTYEFGHLHGHMQLYVEIVPPLLVLVGLLRLRDRLGRMIFIAATALLLLFQIGVSTEVLATTCVSGATAWLVFFLFADAGGRQRLWRLAWESSVAAALMVLVAAPFLYYVFAGIGSVPYVINPPLIYSIDLLNFFIPTPLTAFGKKVFASIAVRFPGNYYESTGYLGLPLIVALAASFRSPTPYRLPLAILVFLFGIFSLGPSLWVNGVQTGIWLPWRIALHLPIIRQALPARFTMFLFLAGAVVLARWLAEPCRASIRVARYGLALLGCLFLIPVHIPWHPLPTEPFFASAAIAKELPRDDNVIILPFYYEGTGQLWQVQSDMYFTQTGGYVGMLPPIAFDPYIGVRDALLSGSVTRNFDNDFTAFVVTSHAKDVLAGPGTPQALLNELIALGWPRKTVGDMHIFHVPAQDDLRYVDVKGDYWGATSDWNWMGRRLDVTTHNRAAHLEVKGPPFTGNQGRISLRVTINGEAANYSADDTNVLTLDLPANARTAVETATTFVPEEVIHNGDRRVLGAMISLQPQ
jgi:hypothetical protein